MKKKFKVCVSWQMFHDVEVEAESVEEAIEIVKDDEMLINPDKDGSYVDESFEVDTLLTLDVAEAEAEAAAKK